MTAIRSATTRATDRSWVTNTTDMSELAAQVADEVEHRGGQRHVERAGGLVAQQHRGRHDGGAGQRHPLALSAGELAGPRLRDVGGQPDAFERVGDPSRRSARDSPVPAAARRSSSPTDQPGVSDAPASWNTICGRSPRPARPTPVVGFARPAIDPQQRRLARAALTDDGDRLTGRDAQAKRRAAPAVCRVVLAGQANACRRRTSCRRRAARPTAAARRRRHDVGGTAPRCSSPWRRSSSAHVGQRQDAGAALRSGATATGSGGAVGAARRWPTRSAARTRSRAAATPRSARIRRSAASLRSRGSVEGRAASASARGCTDARRAAAPSAVGPTSASRPAYITATRSATCAATPRSWVINTMLQPISSRRPRSRPQHLRLHRDVERGGRLVGDDQLGVARDRHRDHHALPQPAGELVRIGPHPARGLRDADGGRAGAAPPRSLPAASATCWPTRMVGFSDVIGSWKTAPRSARRTLRSALATPRPCRPRDPDRAARRSSGLGQQARAALRPSTLLPEPDSPTRPRISPGAISSETPRSACTSRPSRLERDVQVVDGRGGIRDGRHHGACVGFGYGDTHRALLG